MSDKREKALAVMKQMLPPDIAKGVETPPTSGFASSRKPGAHPRPAPGQPSGDIANSFANPPFFW